MNLPDDSTDEEVAECNRRQEFVRDASPDRWIEYSLELQEAAASMWKMRGGRMEFSLTRSPVNQDFQGFKRLANPRAYVLLAGLALENSLKAQLIIEQPAMITDAKLHKPIKTHCLTGLMDRIRKLTFSEADRELASVCESAIPYWGRYPVPLDFTALESEHQISDDFHDVFITLNTQVRKAVYDNIKDGWDSGAGTVIMKLRSKEFDDDLQLNEPFL